MSEMSPYNISSQADKYLEANDIIPLIRANI